MRRGKSMRKLRAATAITTAYCICIFAMSLPRTAHAANYAFSGCTVTTPPNMIFITPTLTSATSFSYSCTIAPGGSGQPATVTIGLSAGSSGNVSLRTMKNGTRSLLYNLYTDAARTIIWGNTSPSWVVSPSTKTSVTNVPLTIYGKIDTASYNSAPAGTYSDSVITLTLTY